MVQVIGETSNKPAELKKFVQTFVLYPQATGYFVLNDIFRYINEEGEDEQDDAAAPAYEAAAATGPLVEDVEMPKAQVSAENPTPATVLAAALDTDVVDKKLETIEAEPTIEKAPIINGTRETKVKSEETPVADAKLEESVPNPETVEKAIEEEEIKEPEKPTEPTPSPAISHLPLINKASAPAHPAAPPKPLHGLAALLLPYQSLQFQLLLPRLLPLRSKLALHLQPHPPSKPQPKRLLSLFPDPKRRKKTPLRLRVAGKQLAVSILRDKIDHSLSRVLLRRKVLWATLETSPKRFKIPNCALL